MLYEEITGKILEGSFEVSKELGAGFLESVYEKALLVAPREKGMIVKRQFPLNVKFRGIIVGEFFADLLVDDRILVQLKAVSRFSPEHFAQIINYLKATGIPVGLIINFGNPQLQYRRFNNKFIS